MKKALKAQKPLNETVVLNKQPPVILVLKRKTVRAFPDGVKVALYYNQKYGINFTVPFDDQGNPESSGLNGSFKEEVVQEEKLKPWDAVHKAHTTKSMQTAHFPDGSKLKVDSFSAGAMHNIHSRLNDANKQKMMDKVNSSKEGFHKIADFCFKQHNK